MKQQNEMYAIYETDDIKQARFVASNYKNVSVMYHNPTVKIPPLLTLKINGHNFTKWNPEYVEYLRKKHPGISNDEIAKCINESLEESLSEKVEIHQKMVK